MEEPINIDTEIQAWLDGKLSDEDFALKVSKENFLKFKQILQEVDSWTPATEGFLPDYDNIIAAKKEVKVRFLGFKQTLLIAASVSVLLVASIFYFKLSDSQTKILAEAGEVRELLLPDGLSKAYLSANSELSWNESDWSESGRKVHLEGKGYFEVEKGSPFVIQMATSTVEVLGTRFEVDAFPDALTVTCFEGKVRSKAGKNQVEVNALESYTYLDETWLKNPQPETLQPEWLKGSYTFKDAELIRVFATLELAYGIKIQHAGINLKRKFTGSFPNDNLSLSLKIIFEPLEIKYRLEGKEVILSN